MAIWSLNNETHKVAIQSIKDILAANVASYDAAIAARNASKGSSVKRSYRNLLTLPVTEDTQEALNRADGLLADVLGNFDPEESEVNYYALMADKLAVIHKHFVEQAELWSETVKITEPASQVQTDEEIQAMAKACDEAFGLLMNNVTELDNHRNDPEAKAMLQHAIGFALTSKSMADGSVKYQLDIERIRKPRTTAAEELNSKRMYLTVNGTPMNGSTFQEETATAFSLSGSAFLNKIKAQNSSFNFDTEYNFLHDNTVFKVIVTKR